jgi:hypothetical protein
MGELFVLASQIILIDLEICANGQLKVVRLKVDLLT